MKALGLLLVFLFAFSCNNREVQEFSVQIRKDFSQKLKILPPIDYVELMGRVPKNSELELGRMLFNDPVISRNNDVSCATCHLTNHGFADGNALNVGAMGKGGPHGSNVGKRFGKGVLSLDRGLGDDGFGFNATSFMFRNSLSTINVAYRMRKDNEDGLFHDGRFGNLFFMTLLPIHTSIEVCGDNPVPLHDNPFEKGKGFFKSPVRLTHVNTFDYFEGRETGNFNAAETLIEGVPTFRPNGTQSIPGRNECLAITVAKIRAIPKYQELFQKAYGREVEDSLIGAALASFILTHVSKNTPYDQFVKGKNSLSMSELRGMVSFFTPLGESYTWKNQKIPGAGCFKCHEAPQFGGTGFASLGVRSDSKSPLTKAQAVATTATPFFGRARLQRGVVPNCLIKDVTLIESQYAPDIGRADGSFDSNDCFKFRVPTLRNVLETYPYFHHGTARGQGTWAKTLEQKAIAGLKQVIEYHLRGPIDPRLYSRDNVSRVFYDVLQQKDFYIPYYRQNFIALNESDPQFGKVLELFPAKFASHELEDLVHFVAYALFDRESTTLGDLGNDVGHAKKVPSGFVPSVTRDNGHQKEWPPKASQ